MEPIMGYHIVPRAIQVYSVYTFVTRETKKKRKKGGGEGWFYRMGTSCKNSD